MALDVKRLVCAKQTVFSIGSKYSLLMGGGRNGLSLGAGVVAFGAQLDYAVAPETGLGGVQRITLEKKF